MSKLYELERLEKAATPGEWRVDRGPIGNQWIETREGIVGIGPVIPRGTQDDDNNSPYLDISDEDAALIAASRNALPALLRLARAAEKRCMDCDVRNTSFCRGMCPSREIPAALRELGVEV